MRRWWAALGGVLGALLLVELAGRALPRATGFSPRAYVFQPDPELGWTCPWQTRQPRRPHVLALGDSFTGGTREIPLERMYPALLGLRLGRPIANLGCSGWGTLQESLLAQRRVPELKPRWLVVGLLPGNDWMDSFDFAHWRSFHPDRPYELHAKIARDNMPCDGLVGKLNAGLVGRSAAYTLVYNFASARWRARHPEGAAYRAVPWAADAGRAFSQDSLLRLRGLARENGARLVVVLVAGRRALCGARSGRTYADDLEFLADNHVAFLDSREALRAEGDCRELFLPDGHWNARAQRAVAAALAARLRNMGK